MPKLSRRPLIQELYAKTGFRWRQIEITLNLTLDLMTQALGEGRNVGFRDFGVFRVVVMEARTKPQPGKPEIQLSFPPRAGVRFKAGKELKSLLKKIDLAKL